MINANSVSTKCSIVALVALAVVMSGQHAQAQSTAGSTGIYPWDLDNSDSVGTGDLLALFD